MSESIYGDPDLAELQDAFEDQRLLVGIGKDLIVERDPERLLKLILEAARRITGADAGSIFLCEETERGSLLRFKHSHTFSKPLDYYEEFTMPRDERSIAGYVSIHGHVLNIPDVYLLDPALPYRFNPGYDMSSGYRTKSMLVVPMRDHKGGIIGVIQLINSKEGEGAEHGADSFALVEPGDFLNKVGDFKPRYAPLMEAVANQAAIALENTRMIVRIEEQFESFVRASVFAIESRDPATSGHSERVASLAVALMTALHEEKEGVYGACFFGEIERRELRYAGLLHDYGKVYIDPRIFTKAKKLFDRDYDCLVMRFKYLHRNVELGFARREMASFREDRREEMAREEEECAAATGYIISALRTIALLNEPQATEVDPEAELERLASGAPPPELRGDLDGSLLPFITDEERRNLSIRRGSLNAEERKIIQSHVTYTEAFVSKIPWPPELAGIPEFCAKHHEMLDGSGYPRGLGRERIPLQARMLAVADIYDALAARDRPYKKALPPDAVRKILEEDAAKGKLDAELVRLFYANDCWKAGETEG
jgi:HD-GYP domain-containing protein (c-di-GMP phosphodiesterase class II)